MLYIIHFTIGNSESRMRYLGLFVIEMESVNNILDVEGGAVGGSDVAAIVSVRHDGYHRHLGFTRNEGELLNLKECSSS